MEIAQIDGRRLYYTFIAGANNIIKNQIHLNKINVFPVKDGDTGTNMASTIRAVIDSISPHKSYKITADRIAESTLMNARGNSGIIFAQFLYGVSNETDDIQTITVTQFIESVKRSVRYIYDAVANPVEGTMLTVIKTWAEFMDTNKARFKDFNQLFVHSIEILEKELAETKTKLKILEKSNVVDAGANAFVFFIKGIIDLIRAKNIRRVMQLRAETDVFPEIEEQIPEEVDLRYCTEAMIKNVDLDQKQLSKLVQEYGDSVVVAGAEKIRRIHVHTNEPAKLFDDLQQHGTITFQKVDDMLRQSDSVYKRKWNIALVTDSACDLSQDLIDKYQIHMLPINVFFGENHYLDKMTIQPEQFYRRLQTDKHFPKTAQVNEVAFRNVYSHLASHYDAIIAVHLTGQFSGTFFSSQKAAEKISKEFKKPIAVLDSKNLSGALGLIVLRIAQDIEQGASFDKIIQKAGQWITDSKIFVSVKTLKYMVRGGRVSPWKGLIANLLNVNPIVSMDENGKSLVFGKTYSQKSNMEKVINHVKDITKDKKVWNYIVLHANNEKGADWYAKELKQLTGKEPTSVVNISPVIGANAGIGAASVAFMYE